MEIGDEILIKAKVVNFDSNPHGVAVEVEIKGFLDSTYHQPHKSPVRIWIHRLDQPAVIAKK